MTNRHTHTKPNQPPTSIDMTLTGSWSTHIRVISPATAYPAIAFVAANLLLAVHAVATMSGGEGGIQSSVYMVYYPCDFFRFP